MVSPGDAFPHRAHEEDRPVHARTPRTDSQLFPCSEAAFQRRRRGPEQQSQSHHAKILRFPHLPLSRTRPLSLTWQITGAGINPRFFLTNHKINASTPYDFSGKNLTPYGGLLPVITMLEKLGFQPLVEQTVTSKRIPRAMDLYRFVLGIVLGLYIGFPRLNQLRFIARDPILTSILRVTKLPVQSSFWRFVNALHRNVARQMLTIMRTMRERVWAAANVKLEVITIDTDTTVHTLYGQQMGGRKSYNPKNKGKKSYQPMLTFIAETREYVWGELRNGDRPTGKQVGDHLQGVFAALPPCIVKIFARADAGFYCGEAVQAYEKGRASFIMVEGKTTRPLEEL